MLVLFGEKTVASTEPLGDFNCPVCNCEESLIGVIEKNYFTAFFIRILPLDTTADYNQCSGCGHAYDSISAEEPLFFSTVKSVLSYLLAGYGLNHGIEVSRKIFHAITMSDTSTSDIQNPINQFNHENNFFEHLKHSAKTMSWLDKSLVVEAAFLLIYAARPIEYEERLQINLTGNALGIGIEGVNAIIKKLQSQQYRGIQSLEIEHRITSNQ